MTCAKKRVTCFITTKDCDVFVGENTCENPQSTCPRLPGEGYEKCHTICQQHGHAEIMALLNAGQADLKGATAELYGICYSCKPCAKALKDAGIKELTIHMEG